MVENDKVNFTEENGIANYTGITKLMIKRDT